MPYKNPVSKMKNGEIFQGWSLLLFRSRFVIFKNTDKMRKLKTFDCITHLFLELLTSRNILIMFQKMLQFGEKV